jgi:hypothetical protein
VRALVVNRVHPPFSGGSAGAARAEADAAGGRATPLGALWTNLADFRAVAEREDDSLSVLARRLAPAPLVRVPLLDDDVHDLDGLARVASFLFPGESPPADDDSQGRGGEGAGDAEPGGLP